MEMNRKTAIKIFILAVCILLVYLCFQHLDIVGSFLLWLLQVFIPFIIAGCITFFLNVPLNAIEKRLFRSKDGKPVSALKEKARRPVAITLSIGIFVVILGVFLLIIIPEIANSLQKIAGSIPTAIDYFQDELKNLGNSYDWAQQIIDSVNIDWTSISSNIVSFFTSNVTNFLSSTMKVVTSVINMTVNVFLGIVLAVYILAKKEKISSDIKKLLYALFPAKAVDYIIDVGVMTNKSFYNSITGQMMECVIIGSLTGFGMAVFGFPYAALVGVLIAICSWIPMFGIAIGTTIGALFILTVNPIQAIWFVVFMICLQQIEGNLIYPRVVGSNIGLPPIILISAIILFSNFFGVIGLLVSAPVSSVLYTLLKRFVYERIKLRNIPEEKYALRYASSTYEPKRAKSDKLKDPKISDMFSKIRTRKKK